VLKKFLDLDPQVAVTVSFLSKDASLVKVHEDTIMNFHTYLKLLTDTDRQTKCLVLDIISMAEVVTCCTNSWRFLTHVCRTVIT